MDRFLQYFHQMKAFWTQMIDLDLFSDISRDVAMATNFVKKMANSLFRRSGGYCYVNVCINSVNDASI